MTECSKNVLQEICQKSRYALPVYNTQIVSDGVCRSSALVCNKYYMGNICKTKKASEKSAANCALSHRDIWDLNTFKDTLSIIDTFFTSSTAYDEDDTSLIYVAYDDVEPELSTRAEISYIVMTNKDKYRKIYIHSKDNYYKHLIKRIGPKVVLKK